MAVAVLGPALAHAGGGELAPPGHRVHDAGLVGFVDARGAVIVPLVYDDAFAFDRGVAVVARGDRWGLVDRTGKELVPPTYEWIVPPGADGLLRVTMDGKRGYMATDGRIVIAPRFEQAEAFDGAFAKVTLDGAPRYIDRAGALQPAGFTPPAGKRPPAAPARGLVSKPGAGGRVGVATMDGREVAPARYVRADYFNEDGLLAVWNDAGRCGYVDATGKETIALRYDDCAAYAGGLAGVKRGAAWGFVDRRGKVVIPFRFEGVAGFDARGGAPAQVAGRWGLIDRRGRWLIRPELPVQPVFDGDAVAWLREGAGRGVQRRLIDRTGRTLWTSASATTAMAMDRVHTFARAWERHRGDADARARAVPRVHAGVAAFFKGNAARVVRELALAELALEGADAATAERLAAELVVVTAPTVVDPQAGPAGIHVHPLARHAAAAGLRVTWRLRAPDGAVVREGALAATVPVASAPLDLTGLADGDYTLLAEVTAGDRVLRRLDDVPVAVIAGLGGRLAALATRIDAAVAPAVDQVSLVHRWRLLDAARAKDTPLPPGVRAAQLIGELDAALARLDAGGRPWQVTPGDHVLASWYQDKLVPLRLFVPARRAPRAPLVIALHGNGVSEHWWFDHYGAGALIETARRRGWYVLAIATEGAAPPVAAALWAAQRLIPYDPSRVYLVGHSFGAAKALEAAAATPALFAGVVALAPGPKPSASFAASMPVFLARGAIEHPWIVTATDGTRAALEAAGARQLRYRELAGVEHYLVVREALDEALAFIAP